jgi:hypothetical protein
MITGNALRDGSAVPTCCRCKVQWRQRGAVERDTPVFSAVVSWSEHVVQTGGGSRNSYSHHK